MKKFGYLFALFLSMTLASGCAKEQPPVEQEQTTTIKAETPAEPAAQGEQAEEGSPAGAAESVAAGEQKGPEPFAARVDALREKVRAESMRPGFKVPENTFYNIDVMLDPDFMTYSARSEMLVVNNSKSPWDELHFHLYPNQEAISGKLKGLKVDKVEVEGKEVEGKDLNTHYVVPLAQPLPAGGTITVVIDFRGMIKNAKSSSGDLTGMIEMLLDSFGGAGDYGVFAFSSGIFSMSLWYPVLSAFDDSGWDTQAAEKMGDFSYFDVADYNVTLRLPDDFAVASTGTQTSQQNGVRTFAAGGVREFTFIGSKELKPTESKTPSGAIIRSWVLGGEEKEGKQQLKTAMESVAFYEEKFGPYPYLELDVVGADLRGGAGGVEFPGIVTIARMLFLSSYLKDIPGGSLLAPESKMLTDTLDFVVAHEVAHQWWNAVVGSHSRKHPFVDEAMANWSALEYMGKVKGKAAWEEQHFMQFELPYQLSRFMGSKDMGVDQPVSAFDSTIHYSAIVYAKGGLFVDAMRAKLGDETMYKAMQNYYEEFAFQIAWPDDIIRHFKEASKLDREVDYLADRWLKGAHADRDIGRINLPRTVSYLANSLGIDLPKWANDLIKEQGVWEAAKVLTNIVQGKNWDDSVDFDKITEMSTRLAKKYIMEFLKGGALEDALDGAVDLLKAW